MFLGRKICPSWSLKPRADHGKICSDQINSSGEHSKPLLGLRNQVGTNPQSI